MKSLNQLWLLLILKIRFNLRSEASTKKLNYVWWVLDPVLQMMVFYVVFEILLKRGGEDFVAFLLCGLVPWTWFNKSVTNSTLSIRHGRGIFSQTYIPKAFFPLVFVGQDLVKQVFIFALLFAFLVIYGYPVTTAWLWLPILVLTQLLVVVAAALLAAFIVPLIEDMQFLIRSLLTLLMFGSGIFYSYEDVLLEKHRTIFLLNPMANLIENYRRVLLHGEAPMVSSLLLITFLMVIIVSLMLIIFHRFDNRLTRLALE